MHPLFASPKAPVPVQPVQRHLRRCVRAAGALLFVSLAACGQPVALSPRCDTATPVQSGLRILVSFQQPTAGDAPSVLAQLQTQALACVRYLSSVSPTLHAYTVETLADIDTVRARLMGWPAVNAVEADALARRH